MGKRDFRIDGLIADFIKGLGASLVSIGSILRYDTDNNFTNPRDIPDLQTVQNLVNGYTPDVLIFTNLDLLTDGSIVYLPFEFDGNEKTFGGLIRVNQYQEDDVTLDSSYFFAAQYDYNNKRILGFDPISDNQKIFITII